MHAQKSSLFVHAHQHPGVHACSDDVMEPRKLSPEAIAAARWLQSLLHRNGLENNSRGWAEVEKRTGLRGEPVDRTTVMRISKATARTTPNPITLQAIARAFGETWAPGAEGRIVGTVEIRPDGTYAFRLNEGVIPTPDLLRASKRAIDAVPESQREETKAIKDRSKDKRRRLEED